MEPKDLLAKLYARCCRMQDANFATASLYFRLHTWLGLPSAILAGIVSSAVFGTLNDSALTWVDIAAGGLSLLSAAMIGAVTFLRFGEKGEQHRVAGAKYAAIKREVELLWTFPPQNLEETLAKLTERWDQITSESPTIPDKLWRRFSEKVYAVDKNTNGN